MSTYICTTKHPVTGKKVQALHKDDYYGLHKYGIGFRIDGKNATINIPLDAYEFFTEEEVEGKTKAITLTDKDEKFLTKMMKTNDKKYPPIEHKRLYNFLRIHWNWLKDDDDYKNIYKLIAAHL